MKQPTEEIAARGPRPSVYPQLERLTAGVLLAFIFSLGWMILVAYLPDFCRLLTIEVEVIVMSVLLALALGLVSLVALLHTR